MQKSTRNFFLSLSAGILSLCTANAQQWGDYTLYSVQNSTAAYLIDTTNAVYHTWTFPTTAKTGYSSYLLEGGTLVRSVARTGNSLTGGGMTGEVQKVDWSGNVIWDYTYSSSSYCLHHDICPMPNGNVLMISYEVKTAAQATAAGSSTSITMWPDKIIEVQPTGTTTGTIVWEWHVWDHLCQNVDASKSNYYSSISDHPELLNINYQTQKDWMHMNGIDYNDSLDQIVFSSHNLNEFYVIDHSTTTAEAASHTGGNSGKGGDFLYRWGNPASYGMTGTANFNVIHDAHWIPSNCPNAGRIVGFNNKGISTTQGCVDEIYPPYNGYNYSITTGSAFGPSTYTKRTNSSGVTNNMGNSQQLPNGNTLICMALQGYIYEIDPAGTTLWSKTATGNVPQAFRYSKCYVTGTPSTPSITQSGDTLTSSSASAYQWYLNGLAISGATSQTYVATQTGAYEVEITDANGCLSDLSPALNFVTSDISEAELNSGVAIYPNPTNGSVKIQSLFNSAERYEVRVFDAYGKLELSAANASDIDLSGYDNGIYNFVISIEGKGALSRKIILIK
jgi:hypothetical protein